MNIGLHNLPAAAGRRRKRVGRGNASGRGSYAGRGQKGQRSRTGGRRHLQQRAIKQFLQQLPKKRGFRSRSGKFELMSVGQLERAFPPNALVTPKELAEKGLVKSRVSRVRILGGSKLTKPLTVRAHGFSKSAEAAITAAGGTVQRIAE